MMLPLGSINMKILDDFFPFEYHGINIDKYSIAKEFII